MHAPCAQMAQPLHKPTVRCHLQGALMISYRWIALILAQWPPAAPKRFPQGKHLNVIPFLKLKCCDDKKSISHLNYG